MIVTRRNMRTSASGHWGEVAARMFLERRGYKSIETNFRTRYGEIDLIVRDDRTIVFVEVKTRERDTGAAEAAVDRRKQCRIVNAARMYASKVRALQFRFDVIVVVRAPDAHVARIRHYPNAFDTDLDF